MSLFSKLSLSDKRILALFFLFALPTHSMMGRFRTGLQRTQSTHLLDRTPAVCMCSYTVPRPLHNEVVLKSFTKKPSLLFPALALGVCVAYHQNELDRTAAYRAYAQKEFEAPKEQHYFVETCLSMAEDRAAPQTIKRFASFPLQHQTALLSFGSKDLEKYPIIYLKTYISSVVNACQDTPLSFSQEQLNLFSHLPGEWQVRLLVALADRLTDEQATHLVNTLPIHEYIYQGEYYLSFSLSPEQMEIFTRIVLKNGSPELKKQFFYRVYLPLYKKNGTEKYGSERYGCVEGDWQELRKWTDALHLYDPLDQIKTPGPLFSEFNKNLLFKLYTQHDEPNIDGLFPEIAEYVAEEYKHDRIVLFHAHGKDWIALGALYRALDEYKQGRKLPSTFLHTRFWTHSPLSQEDLAKEELQWKHNTDRNTLLFTTLHFADGVQGNNTLWYFITNFDQKTKRGQSINHLIKEMFVELDMVCEYQKLLEKNPTIFQELQAVCDEAIKEQGNYGQLLIISLPKKLARKLSYLSEDSGQRKYTNIDGVKTSDTVTIAEHFERTAFDKQIALKLSEEIINPEAAQKAGVKIIAIDPAAYWRTEKYRKAEAKIQEIIELIKEIRDEKEGVTIQGSPF
jgi:hypothetical protein